MHAFLADAMANITARYGSDGIDVTAGGAGDNTEVDGAYIDRRDFASLKVVIGYTATLGAGESLSLAFNLQDDADGSGVGIDFGTAYGPAIVASSGGGGTVTGVVEFDFDLSGAKQYVRGQFTPNLSRATTDVAELSMKYILGGKSSGPASASLI